MKSTCSLYFTIELIWRVFSVLCEGVTMLHTFHDKHLQKLCGFLFALFAEEEGSVLQQEPGYWLIDSVIKYPNLPL